MTQYSIIGKRVPRVDAKVKATGEARYTADLKLPGMLYGMILRSPLPHARILNIDTSKAERLPGVKAAITGKDTPGITYGLWRLRSEFMDELPLAIDKVRYIGDEVAAVAAIDEDTAREALELIRVDYEELPAVFDPAEAIKEGAPQIHDRFERNINTTRRIEYGDVERGLKESDYIREDKFLTHAVTHAPMEPHVCIASFDLSGKLTIWTSTQVPYFVQCLLALTLGMREGDVRVIKPYVGGGFGGKSELFSLEPCSALLSKKTGRPVKIEYTREEELSATRRRHPMSIELRTGVKKDGTLVTREIKAILDGGAYSGWGPTTTMIAGLFAALPYRVPNYRYDGLRVLTNKVPGAPMRGHAAMQPVFAFESQLDMIADDLGIDPVELRAKNARQAGDEIPAMTRIPSCGLSECIEEVQKSTAYVEKRGKLPDGRGIGMGCYGFFSGQVFNLFNSRLPYSEAWVKLNEDGTASLFTPAADIGLPGTPKARECMQPGAVEQERVESRNAQSVHNRPLANKLRLCRSTAVDLLLSSRSSKTQFVEFAQIRACPP